MARQQSSRRIQVQTFQKLYVNTSCSQRTKKKKKKETRLKTTNTRRLIVSAWKCWLARGVDKPFAHWSLESEVRGEKAARLQETKEAERKKRTRLMPAVSLQQLDEGFTSFYSSNIHILISSHCSARCIKGPACNQVLNVLKTKFGLSDIWFLNLGVLERTSTPVFHLII